MKRIEFMVRTSAGQSWLPITAYVSSDEDCFVVHRMLGNNGVWVISHRKVGYKIPRLVFPRRKDALSAAREFNRLPGWRRAFFNETTCSLGGVSSAAQKSATKLIAFINHAVI